MSDPNTGGAGTAAPAAAAGAPANNGAGNMVPITALHEEREKRQAMAAELETLKAQMASQTSGASAAPASEVIAGAGNTAAPASDFYSNLDNLWREDPRRAMQTELMMAINWQDQVNSKVDEQIETLSAKHKDFGDYSAEVKRYIRKLPVEQRSKPGIAEAAFYMVKGQKTDTLVKTEAERLLQKAKAGEGVQTFTGGTSSGGGAPAGGGLSPEEKAAAAALGISETEYLKYRK